MHEILLSARYFPAPFKTGLLERFYDQAVRLETEWIISRMPGAGTQQFAARPELNTVAIQPVVGGVDINRDPE